MVIKDDFKSYVLRHIDSKLKQKLFYAYKNGLDFYKEIKEELDEDLLNNFKKWFNENGVLEYV